MEIILIRHQKVKYKFKKKYSSFDYEKAWKLYDFAEIEDQNSTMKKLPERMEYDIFISSLKRTYLTAVQLFGKKNFIKTDLLNEVPINAFMKTKRKIHTSIWNFIARFLWYLDSPTQKEPISKSKERSNKAIDFIEANSKGAFVVTHGFMMIVLIKQLKKRGYKFSTLKRFAFKNCEFIICKKNERPR